MPTNFTPGFHTHVLTQADVPTNTLENPYRPLHVPAKPDHSPNHHDLMTAGRKASVTMDKANGKTSARAWVTTRYRTDVAATGPSRYAFAPMIDTRDLPGATRDAAIDVLEQVLLDALDDVRAMRGR